MGKSDRSNYWFVRSDGPESFLRQKCGELATQMDVKAVLAVYHEGDSKENPHMHAVVELSSEPQKQSFDVRIKKLFEITKKSNYSTKIWDGIRDAGAASYMFHEEQASILVNKGWTVEELATAKAANAAVQKVVAVNKQRAKTTLPVRAKEHFVGQQPGKYEILEYMIELIHAGEVYHPGEFMLKRYVEEVELQLLGKNDLGYYVRDLHSRLWR